jgi:GWxTD domain-containing protein
VIEVRDKENKIQAQQKCFFQRVNAQLPMDISEIKSISVEETFVSKYKNVDTLAYYIKCLGPISSPSEFQFAQNQLSNKDLLLMQQYFYNFWKSRYASNPEESWLKYFQDILSTNKDFGSHGRSGFDSDRGRVYLQYGPPTNITTYNNEQGALPYEIWEYNQVVDRKQQLTNPGNKQSNKKFIFYNPDLVSNQFVLIHSDARGETNNIYWKNLVYKRNLNSSSMDNSNFDNFNAPR